MEGGNICLEVARPMEAGPHVASAGFDFQGQLFLISFIHSFSDDPVHASNCF